MKSSHKTVLGTIAREAQGGPGATETHGIPRAATASAERAAYRRAFEKARQRAESSQVTVLVKDGKLTEEGKRRGTVLPSIEK